MQPYEQAHRSPEFERLPDRQATRGRPVWRPCLDASVRKATPVVAALSKSAATVAPSELACPITPMAEGKTFLTTGTQQNRRRRCMPRPAVFTIDRGRALVNALHLSVVSGL